MDEQISLSQVFEAFKANMQNNLHVADCGIITNIDNSGITLYSVTLVPVVDTKFTIYCYALENLVLQKDDLVLVLYTDKQNKQTIEEYSNNMKLNNLSKTKETISKHSYNYGIIIGKIDTTKKEVN